MENRIKEGGKGKELKNLNKKKILDNEV